MRHPDFAPKLDRPAACRGASALLEALESTYAGTDGKTASIIISETASLRELVRFALVKLASEGQQ
jgi:hypothetical protein